MGYETELTELVGPSGKTLRVYEDVDGNVQMELNGTYTTDGNPVVTANINPLTGGISLSVGGSTYALSEVLGQQHVDSQKTDADGNESVLYSLTIPSGKVGPNDSLLIRAIYEFTNSAVSKNRRIRLGGISGTQMQYDASGAGVLGFVEETYIHARGATNSQLSSRVLGNSGVVGSQSVGTYATAARDMMVDQDLVITGQWASAGAGSGIITLKSVIVMLVRAAA